MDTYVDGFVIPVPKDRMHEYRRMAERAGEIWMEHGALEYRECVGDDLEPKDFRGFREAAGAREDETVVFSWIMYESREHRDKVNAEVMADPRMTEMMKETSEPFECGRMAYGGFRTIVQLTREPAQWPNLEKPAESGVR
ncbi:MAG: DUF1428 domain-containing protein [Phycisphaerae bacterium]|nr:DUF1428 domain-containing protein [Phycisphaerae bacterium]